MKTTANNIKKILKTQDDFFKTGKTLELTFRIEQLKELKKNILNYEKEISDALYKDLKKSPFEAYATEIGIILDEINYFIKNIKKWAKPERRKTNLLNYPAKSFIYNEPYGRALIITPWNYPFQLVLSPLIGSIAAGNTAVIKPSELSAATSNIIKKLILKTFLPEYITVIEGGIETNKFLLNQKWNFIFFTGSVNVGKIVMSAASKNLTPIVLELGGKSPAIVTKNANLQISARRIVWGKFLNAGQTCVAPDYLLIDKDIKEKFIEFLKNEIKKFYGDNPLTSNDYSRIISKAHFERLLKLFKKEKIIFGGKSYKSSLMIAPTIIANTSYNTPLMKEEIFGPILPVLTFDSLDEAFSIINKNPNPLASYLFSENKKEQKYFLSRVRSGGTCINETIMHLSNPNLPFGGIMTSGIGRYHGRASFEAFSNQKSVLAKKTFFDIPLRYPPYKNKLKLIKKILN